MQQPISAGAVISHRYQIQKKIQSNTFNSCYLAEDAENSNRLVMLSLPRIELLILPDFMPTFEKVCAKLMRTPFQGLLKVLGHGDYHAHPYAVLQYVTDETLEHVLARKRISSTKVDMDSVLDWATPLASTLDEMHEFGYVHGSLKPSSVHIGSQKILMGDFITEYTLQLMGKFKNGITTLNVDEYLSPEYLKSSYTANYDQYLLATMVYEALAGKVPFARTKGGEDYRMQVATHVSPLLTAHRPELKAVSDVLAKAMKRKPTDRYKSCRAFITQLQEAQAVEPAKPPPQKRVVITTPFSDEPEEEEEAIVTSIRRTKQQSGSKKGLVWLSVLFVTGGAAAFTVVNYPHLLGLKGKQQVDPIIVPVAITPVPSPVAPSVSEVEESKADKEVADESFNASTATEAEIKPEIEVAKSSSDTIAPEELAVSEGNVSSEGSSTPTNVVTSDQGAQKEALDVKAIGDLQRVVNEALEAGNEDFKVKQALSEQAQQGASALQSELEKEVTRALLKGQSDFASSSDGESSTDVKAENSESAINSTLPIPTSDVSSQESDPSDTEITPTVATEVVPPAPAVDIVSRAAQVLSDPKLVVQPVPTASTAKAVTPAAKEVALVKAPVDPVLAAQAERNKLQALKQQKVARIKGITDDCTIGGKIHIQTAAGNLAYVKKCLSVGVKATLKQSNGKSLLHAAARGGHLNICKLLIAKGAAINAKANNGQTPLDMAIVQKKDRVAAYLATRGAK